MKIPQFALLSPDPFVLQGVGTLKSPTLKEISPSNMMKYSLYALATQVLFGSKQDIIELGKNMGENNIISINDYLTGIFKDFKN